MSRLRETPKHSGHPLSVRHLLVDKLYNLLHRLGRWRRSRIPLDETFGLAFEQLKLYLITCLAAVHHEAVDASARMSDVTDAS
jgi:hypothetical protein